MEEEFSVLSSRLKLISSIEDKQKLYIYKNDVNMYDDNFKNSIWRFVSGNSREKTIKFINKTVDKSMFFILMNTNNINKTIILNDLIKCKEGIMRLFDTYDRDKMMVSKLRVIYEKIDGFTNNIKT